MRVTRAKQYRRYLRFFRIVYGITPPYKVILDGNFLHQCISTKVDIDRRLASVLQGASFRLYTPKAAQDELEALGPDFDAAFQFAKTHCRAIFGPRAVTVQEGGSEEGQDGGGDDPAEQIARAVGVDNPNKYIVATQDENLRVRLRKVPGCPLLHVSRTVLLMEGPSGKSKADFERSERMKEVGLTEEEVSIVKGMKRKESEEKWTLRAAQSHKRIKKKASAPNPLSCRPKAKGAGKGTGKEDAKGSEHRGDGKPRRKRKKRGSSEGRSGGGGGEGGQDS